MTDTRETIQWLKSIRDKYIHGGDDGFDEKRRQAIDEAIRVLDLIANGVTVQEWIPVTERLPEKQADVLLYFGGKYKNMATGFWHGEEKMNAVYWFAYTDDGLYTDCDYKPTHWMPLPEPPKGD